MDGPELTPATRKRSRTEAAVTEASAAGEDGTRFVAIETALRAIDVRLEHLERTVSTGFQEIASRSLVVAEATDEALSRIEAAIPVAATGEGVAVADPRLVDIQRRLDDLAVAVVALQPTIDAILDLRSHVELVGGRLADLLGGPTLTELMDRLDEIADQRRTENDQGRGRRGR